VHHPSFPIKSLAGAGAGGAEIVARRKCRLQSAG
jgi:hypothetical protein